MEERIRSGDVVLSLDMQQYVAFSSNEKKTASNGNQGVMGEWEEKNDRLASQLQGI